MCACLEHRGPDDEGYFTAPGVGLAMRRLAIIDLKSGHQPITNETGDVHVVFNGEIYNYQELTDRLRRSGHTFVTSSDTETIVHLYEEHGLDFVDDLRGMFAIAVWDATRRRLVLARDRLGEKPLYYAQRGTTLLFGSEIKAILQAGWSRTPDRQAVCDFLALGYVAAPRTFYGEVKKLGPGQRLVCEDGRVEVQTYWQRDTRCRHAVPYPEAVERVADLLGESTRLCLKSDVEVGAFLSGGIDSSVLVALMRQCNAKVQTFSVGYEGTASGFNELGYARRVAEKLGTQHHELILGAHSTVELLPKILWHYDEPHGEPTSVLVYLLCEFTRQRVKVAVGGTGGDEVFFGYPRHAGIRMHEYYRHVPRLLREQVLERVIRRWPESTRGRRFAKRAKRFVKGAGLPPDEAYLSWVSLLSAPTREALIAPQVRSAVDDPAGEAFLRHCLCDPAGGGVLERAANLDIGGYLPEYQLTYMDRMSMANSLEVRSPLCDYHLVEYVTGLPNAYRLRRTRSKHILKEVAKRWIPKEIVERRKVGFDSPIGQWVKQHLREFMEHFLAPEQVRRTGLLNPQAVRSLWADHLTGRSDYSLQLWSLMALEAWHRMYIEDKVADGRSYRLNDLRGAIAVASPPTRAAVNSVDRTTPRREPVNDGPPQRKAHATGLRKRLWQRTPRPLRNLLAPVADAVNPDLLLGGQFRAWTAFVARSERWDHAEAAAYQLGQLRRICELAYRRSAFYRHHFAAARFDPRELESLEQLRALPLIDRETIKANLDAMCTQSPTGPGVDRISTGGTDGRPLTFYIGADRSPIEFAYLVSSWRRIGYRPEIPLAVFRSSAVAEDCDGLRHEYDPVLRQHHYSTFHMDDDSIQHYLEHLRTIGPCFLHVYPSAVAMLARFIERTATTPPANVLGIIAESEIVYPQQRKLAEEVFGRRYFSCYGHSEKLVLAAECEHTSNYHVWPTYGYFELLDEAGRPVTTPGVRGEIVGTGFINRVVPFIRYRTGDFATYVADRCGACGRDHPVIADIRGHRTQEFLVARDGSAIPWVALNMHDDTFRRVSRFQFYQDTPGRARLRVIPADGFDESESRRIQQHLTRKLDGRLDISIEPTDAIPLSPRGKRIYVDQRISDIRLELWNNPYPHETAVQ